MDKELLNFPKIKHIYQPFTELFSLIKLYDILPNGYSITSYRVDQLKGLRRHADNAINISLQGLQDIGNLINLIEQCKSTDLNGVGYLVSSISNLVEALYDLKKHADFALRQIG